jgi:hypothetical protein
MRSRHSTSNVTCPSKIWLMVDVPAALVAAIALRALALAATAASTLAGSKRQA